VPAATSAWSTPSRIVVASKVAAAAVVAREAAPGRPLVLKPLFGSQGEGLQLITRGAVAAGDVALEVVHPADQLLGRQLLGPGDQLQALPLRAEPPG
jgi:glutathione synthase/RimK-type ligase-like ATP-grasp enzyme